MSISVTAVPQEIRSLALLAPSPSHVHPAFQEVELSGDIHGEFLAGLQRLRGAVYLADGAIGPDELTADGRHEVPSDLDSWHVLSVDGRGRVRGCARYRPHAPGVALENLVVSSCPLARSPEWGPRFREAVESEMEQARLEGLSYVEVGGWALGTELRMSPEALRLALASYALADILGGCLGISTVTHRHCSAQILRRIGGRPLAAHGVELPEYFDPHYNCWMEVLRFDSRQLNPRYAERAQAIRRSLLGVPVVCASSGYRGLQEWLRAPENLVVHPAKSGMQVA